MLAPLICRSFPVTLPQDDVRCPAATQQRDLVRQLSLAPEQSPPSQAEGSSSHYITTLLLISRRLQLHKELRRVREHLK